MEVHDQLKQFGLTASESTVYLFLLQNGLCTPPAVSQETGIARTNCYNILATLLDKDLIEERLDGKHKAYLARNPESLLQMLEVQRQAAVRLLPDLKALHTAHKNKPVISYYAGWEEVRTLLYQSFEAPQGITTIGSLDIFAAQQPSLYSFYKDELSKRGIQYRELRTGVSQETTVTELYKAAQLPISDTLPTVIVVWDENVSFITLEEPVFATLLRNRAIATTFQLLFTV